MNLPMRKKIGWLLFGSWVFAWTACALSIGASEPLITGDNIDQVAQNAPALFMKAIGCGVLALIGGPMILLAFGITGRKNP